MSIENMIQINENDLREILETKFASVIDSWADVSEHSCKLIGQEYANDVLELILKNSSKENEPVTQNKK